jgi:hypothetical protein
MHSRHLQLYPEQYLIRPACCQSCDGTVTRLWTNPAKKENTLVDMTVGVAGFKGTDGQWIAYSASCSTYVEVGAGERLVDSVIIDIDR